MFPIIPPSTWCAGFPIDDPSTKRFSTSCGGRDYCYKKNKKKNHMVVVQIPNLGLNTINNGGPFLWRSIAVTPTKSFGKCLSYPWNQPWLRCFFPAIDKMGDRSALKIACSSLAPLFPNSPSNTMWYDFPNNLPSHREWPNRSTQWRKRLMYIQQQKGKYIKREGGRIRTHNHLPTEDQFSLNWLHRISRRSIAIWFGLDFEDPLPLKKN